MVNLNWNWGACESVTQVNRSEFSLNASSSEALGSVPLPHGSVLKLFCGLGGKYAILKAQCEEGGTKWLTTPAQSLIQ